ncbi:hypothetical protein [Lacrimispora sp.]|uniref:hypothetical protein n=1 Tax=Lacrimispora sp. TaxID=2719234 RepID=UPI0032E45B37
MAANKSYKPVANTLAASAAIGGLAHSVRVLTTSWGLILLNGVAFYSNQTLKSGAVAVWVSNAPTTGQPTNLTFTDANGNYGVTTKAGVSLVVKFYNN